MHGHRAWLAVFLLAFGAAVALPAHSQQDQLAQGRAHDSCMQAMRMRLLGACAIKVTWAAMFWRVLWMMLSSISRQIPSWTMLAFMIVGSWPPFDGRRKVMSSGKSGVGTSFCC